MPRKARKETKSKINHIVVQGQKKEYIFKTEKNMQKYFQILKSKKQDSIVILSYCIMHNHAHILVFSNNIENVSKYMQKVNTAYSNYYNKVQNRVGYVFKDRFYSQSIESERQLYNCINYIHNNPVKAGICNNPEDYKYSSIHNLKDNQKVLELIKKICDFNNYEKFDDNIFIDIKDININDYIEKIKKQYNILTDEIKNNKGILKKVIKEAREQTEVSIEELAKILEISKSTVARYAKK